MKQEMPQTMSLSLIHILAHEAIGTVETGAVRISLNYKNTKAEIDHLLDTLRSR